MVSNQSPEHSFQTLGDVFAVEAHLPDGKPVLQVMRSFTFTVHYDGTGVTDEGQLALLYWNGELGEWVRVPDFVVDTNAHTIVGRLDRLTFFAISRESGARIYLPAIQK